MGYWAVVPAEIRYDDQIPANAKLLYAEISSLLTPGGYCEASNAYFAGLYQITERSVRRLLDALAERGYIRIDERRGNHGTVEERRIYAGLNPLQNLGPLDKNVRPLDKNVQRHIINKTNIPPISPTRKKIAESLPPDVWEAILTAAGEDAALLEAWLDFAEVRAKKRAPIKTVRTVELLRRKIETCGGDAKALLEQSTERGWTGIFEFKDGVRGGNRDDGGGDYWSEEERY